MKNIIFLFAGLMCISEISANTYRYGKPTRDACESAISAHERNDYKCVQGLLKWGHDCAGKDLSGANSCTSWYAVSNAEYNKIQQQFD